MSIHQNPIPIPVNASGKCNNRWWNKLANGDPPLVSSEDDLANKTEVSDNVNPPNPTNTLPNSRSTDTWLTHNRPILTGFKSGGHKFGVNANAPLIIDGASFGKQNQSITPSLSLLSDLNLPFPMPIRQSSTNVPIHHQSNPNTSQCKWQM